MTLDIGKLYDGLADGYDHDVHGLLGSGRAAALAQIATSVPSRADMTLVDLGAGTGTSLAALASRFPGAQAVGIDISSEMLSVAATKLPLRSIVADAATASEHLPPSSVDLALMHFITTFVDVGKTLRGCREILRPGGYLSVVSTVFGAFPRVLSDVALKIATIDEIMAVNPVPMGRDALVDDVRAAGFEIVAVDEVLEPVTFPTGDELLDFGVKSGFFTHIITALGEERIAAARAALEPLFPIADEYRAVAVLARLPQTV